MSSICKVVLYILYLERIFEKYLGNLHRIVCVSCNEYAWLTVQQYTQLCALTNLLFPSVIKHGFYYIIMILL